MNAIHDGTASDFGAYAPPPLFYRSRLLWWALVGIGCGYCALRALGAF